MHDSLLECENMENYVGSIVWDGRVCDIFTEKTSFYIDHTEWHVNRYENRFLRLPEIETGARSGGYNIKPGTVRLGGISYENVKHHPDYQKILEKLQMVDMCLMQDFDGIIEGFTFVPNGRSIFGSRKAFIKKPFEFDNETYCGLEIKGCSYNGGPINRKKFRTIGPFFPADDSGPLGGLYFDESCQSLSNGITLAKTNPLEIACFELPFTVESRFHGTKNLGLEVRAVKSSLRTSETAALFPDVIKSLKLEPEEFLERYERNLFSDLNHILSSGFYHCHLHNLNVDATGSITDLGELEKISENNKIADNFYNAYCLSAFMRNAAFGGFDYKPARELAKQIIEDKKIKKIAEDVGKYLIGNQKKKKSVVRKLRRLLK